MLVSTSGPSMACGNLKPMLTGHIDIFMTEYTHQNWDDERA
jgi:hypothetical protein